MNIEEIVEKNIELITSILIFWKDCECWAPDNIRKELDLLEIDRLISFLNNLKLFEKEELNEGELILFHITIGVILEAMLVIFYTIWIEDYNEDLSILEKEEISSITNDRPYFYRYRKENNKTKPFKKPSELELDLLKVFSKNRLFSEYDKKPFEYWREFIENVQVNRNSVHILKKREIQECSKCKSNLEKLFELVNLIDSKLIYPEGYNHGIKNLKLFFQNLY